LKTKTVAGGLELQISEEAGKAVTLTHVVLQSRESSGGQPRQRVFRGEELKALLAQRRIGGFERRTLVVETPNGRSDEWCAFIAGRDERDRPVAAWAP
jgi:hypothetical protein